MLAHTVAWLAQLPADRKLLLLLCVYGASAAPLLFWIMWRVVTRPAPKVCSGCAVCAACFAAAARACTFAWPDSRTSCAALVPLLMCSEYWGCLLQPHQTRQSILTKAFSPPCVQVAARSTPAAAAQSKAISSSDAAALAKVISSRRSVFPRDFSKAPLDRCFPCQTRKCARLAVQVC